ncbi:3-mercaptopyruvate sulfurtransferase [Arsukibacterium ikkense]|uniref:3-mercaptopyruvate sulfurtransferase n=1 Tax=Arsukibacterium ikkense TaxID=336831 RepID=A0A0M2VCD4_9GAMM|nr:sulfurtransferase [Arsukibacterium ikkense]KKO46783.1 3-mercaptopyruvate sulfurtransferase [Arsukibacterium ikkense]
MQLPLVTTRWLDANLNAAELVLIDVSMRKIVGKEAIVYPTPLFIPGSKRLDLETTLCDVNSSQANAFPTEAQFTGAAQRLGINSDSIVVLYDNQGTYAAPRAWWIFQAMGVKNAFVLDGGLAQWLSEKRAVVATLAGPAAAAGDIQGALQAGLVCNSDYIFAHLASGQLAILDARSHERFLGLKPEPRAGVRSGHIPYSLNLPFAEVLDGHCFKNPEQLAQIFSKLIGSKTQPLVFSCGSGITACIILLAAVMAGYQNVTLYDGSWADWGSNATLPVA